jgi:hypothetical protein
MHPGRVRPCCHDGVTACMQLPAQVHGEPPHAPAAGSRLRAAVTLLLLHNSAQGLEHTRALAPACNPARGGMRQQRRAACTTQRHARPLVVLARHVHACMLACLHAHTMHLRPHCAHCSIFRHPPTHATSWCCACAAVPRKVLRASHGALGPCWQGRANQEEPRMHSQVAGEAAVLCQCMRMPGGVVCLLCLSVCAWYPPHEHAARIGRGGGVTCPPRSVRAAANMWLWRLCQATPAAPPTKLHVLLPAVSGASRGWCAGAGGSCRGGKPGPALRPASASAAVRLWPPTASLSQQQPVATWVGRRSGRRAGDTGSLLQHHAAAQCAASKCSADT